MSPDNTSGTTADGAARPCITIITVTYNAESSLATTLDSVACQDYPHIEHLIIDGCSSDHTLSIVQHYVEANTARANAHAIRLITEPDEGLYDAMNKGLQQATGDYIVFLNAGDRLHAADTISHVVQKAEWVPADSSNPAILYGETDIVGAEGRFLRHRRLRAPKQLTWRSFRCGMMVCHQSFYVRADLAREEPYNLAYRFSADYDWCIRLMKRAQRRRLHIVDTQRILTDYLSEGLTTKNHSRSLRERLRIMALHYGWPVAITQHCWFVLRAVLLR